MNFGKIFILGFVILMAIIMFNRSINKQIDQTPATSKPSKRLPPAEEVKEKTKNL